jgi:hypothetical protein
MRHFFSAGKRGAKTPRFPRNSPQSHHQNTTTCTRFFPKTPAKTPLHHAKKNYGRYFAGIGLAGDSESQKMFTTQ